MKKITTIQVITFLLGPGMIIPLAIVFAIISLLIYGEPPEIHQTLERALFFQGNTDLGGGMLFAATVGLYVAFGFTSSWYLVLELHQSEIASPFSQRLLRSLGFLKYHIFFFIIGGALNFSYDGRVTPNDFRNMFLLACMLYLLSICFIVALSFSKMSLFSRLSLAPLFMVVWLIIGSDGNTARAGQLVNSGQDPQPITRGVRHGIMLSWHQLCDSVFGDIKEKE